MITERLYDKRVKQHVQEKPLIYPNLKEQEWPWPTETYPELSGLRVYHIPSEQIGVVKWQHAGLVGVSLRNGRFQQCPIEQVSVLSNQ